MLFCLQLECFSSLLEPMTNNWNNEKLEHIRYLVFGGPRNGESFPCTNGKLAVKSFKICCPFHNL